MYKKNRFPYVCFKFKIYEILRSSVLWLALDSMFSCYDFENKKWRNVYTIKYKTHLETEAKRRRQANARVYLYCENISFITSPQFEVLMFHILSGCLHWRYANCVFSWILAHLSNCLDVWRTWRISSPVPVNRWTPHANQTRTTRIRFHCSALNFPPCLELKIHKNLNTVLY